MDGDGMAAGIVVAEAITVLLVGVRKLAVSA